MTARAWLTVCVVAALVLAACGAPRSFRRQSQIEIESPAPHAWTTQPVELRWEITDPDLRRKLDEGSLVVGVFIDRPPIGPGENLLDLVDEDCERREGCPSAAWFADRRIYVTRQTALQLRGLPDNRPTDRGDVRDPHEAVLVLLDDAGYRVGESYYHTRFAVDRTL